MESIRWKAVGSASSRAYIRRLTVLLCMSYELPEAVKDEFVVSYVPHTYVCCVFHRLFRDCEWREYVLT
jgi:hypothetical protein